MVEKTRISRSDDGDSDNDDGDHQGEMDMNLLRTQIGCLASSQPDAVMPLKRKALIEEVREKIANDPTNGRKLLSLMWNDLQCTLLHATRRIVQIVTTCLLVEGDDDEDVDRHLLRLLIRLLAEAGSSELVAETCEQLSSSSISGDGDKEKSKRLAKILYDDCSSCMKGNLDGGDSPYTSTMIPAAVSVGSTLDQSSSSLSWMNMLLQISIEQFVSCDELQLAKPFFDGLLLGGATPTGAGLEMQQMWKETIASSLKQKLKSHPDKSMSTILGWIMCLPSYETCKQTIDLDEEWMTLLLKQLLQQPKETNRLLASRILIEWSGHSPDALATAAKGLAGSLASTTLAPVRVTVYETLEQIAIQSVPKICAGNAATTIDSRVTETVLTGLVTRLEKETKSSAEARTAGQQALVEWIVFAKRSGEEVGYKAAIGYVAGPTIAAGAPAAAGGKNKATATVAEAGAVLGLLVQRIHPDLLESIAADFWKCNTNNDEGGKKWEKGLEALTVAPVNAKTKTSALVESGLLAVYFCLLYAGYDSSNTLPKFAAAILSAGSSTKKSDLAAGGSFLFSSSMFDAVSSNPTVRLVLPRSIALYTQLAATNESASLQQLFPKGKVTAACRAMAVCSLYPATLATTTTMPLSQKKKKDQFATNALLSCLETILTYQPMACENLVEALYETVNNTALHFETAIQEKNATSEARLNDNYEFPVKFDANAVRRVARLLMLSKQCCHPNTSPRILSKVLVLMHVGSTQRQDGHQRAALILNSKRCIEQVIPNDAADADKREALAEEISLLCTTSEESAISDCVHASVLSLLTSLGGIASNYSPDSEDPDDEEMKPYVYASKLCIKDLAPRLSRRLELMLFDEVEILSADDIDLYQSPTGTLFEGNKPSSASTSETKKVGGRHLTEDEEWELQMKKELAEKKKAASGGSSIKSLTPEQKKLVAEQDTKRKSIASLLDGQFVRLLASIRCLCLSDIEVGNECLPVVMESVILASVSTCPALSKLVELRKETYITLNALSASVFEIEEKHAPTVSQALLISCRKEESSSSSSASSKDAKTGTRITVSALPSPCASAACVIYEMDQVHDALSGTSFALLFPVIRASVMGPRTPPGCEAALRVLARHTELLAEGKDCDPRIASLRRDMAISVLELLKHDRSQTFQDPTPYEVLVSCYRIGEDEQQATITTSELAPLLDERGALGPKACRIGSMLVLADIAKQNRSLVKNNPLVENRIWVNCFEQDDSEIRQHARRAWMVVHDVDNGDGADDISVNALPAPSLLYAAPLLPLLSHSNMSISKAAANAYANGMVKHPNSVSRNVEALCKTYIDSFPTSVDAAPAEKGGTKAVAPPSKKAPALKTGLPSTKKPATSSLGLPKKKPAVKKSALAVAGIGKPRTAGVKKKTAAHSALLKPKQERTLDQAALQSQFKIGDATTTKKDAEKDSESKVVVRHGVLRAIAAMTADSSSSVKVSLDEQTLELLSSFLMAYGIAESHDGLRAAARNDLRDIVASQGETDEAISFLLPHLETVLSTGIVKDESSLGSLSVTKIPKSISSSDRRKEGAVVALGSVAIHLKGPENEAKVDNTIDMLITALKTPSEDVQMSVADALSKLMKKGRTQERIETILDGLLNDCLRGDSLAVQRGAAYGLSAAVKGSGIVTLKKYEIVKKLEDALNSGSSSVKEGSLFAIELLCGRLGLLFEPYVIALLPSLLKSFSDSSDHVRKAAADTVGLIMSKLSAHGVKLVMPAVLTSFDDPAWRTKQASIHMLGSMSHLAPKQLASALPKVVPKLTEAFSDTHPKVKASAQLALEEISTVVRNPEISSISPILLKALTDPADNTILALDALISTEFLHAIDAPSLALIVPIIHRGLRDRGATTKRFSGLIAGNITTMINAPSDFVPYLPTLLPDLQTCLLDPIPDVRSTSAKALGSLTRTLGDQILPELRPWLMKKLLRDENCSSAERSGAAQGLTEVLIATGTNSVYDAMRTEILPLSSYPESSTREGVLWMLTFLPPAMGGQGYSPLIDVSLPALIAGLSDDNEQVRDVALRAGRVLIRSHGKVYVDKILPSLEEGLANTEDYRIRVASLSLLGDLLSMIGNTSLVKGDGDTQDDIRRAERAQAQIALALGQETRRRVLSSLYLARSDNVHVVRQSALQVWKTVVSHTGRALRDILPVLVSQIINDLASGGNHDKTVVAGKCLGDIVSKLGDAVLPQIMPVLRNALYEDDGGDGDNDDEEDTISKRRQRKVGVCIGLTEVIQCSTKEQILRYIEIIVKVVQDALCDDDEDVRSKASKSFQSLHNVVGSRAMDEIVPSLMVSLESHDDERTRTRALNGLTGILSVRSRELLPYILPRLISRPITIDHAHAISSVARVTGNTLYSHYNSVIPALLNELSESEEATERIEAIRDSVKAICSSIEEESDGVTVLINEIASKCGNEKSNMRRESCKMLEVVVKERADMKDFYEHLPTIYRELLYRLNDDDADVLKATNGALVALAKCVPAEELVKHVEFIRNLIASMVSDARRRKGGVGDGEFLLPGFNMPKGLDPLMPIFQRGILYGSPAVREVSAAGLGELISLTSSKYLAGPFIVKMTGPLLRVVGDRNPANVKVAILKTLGLILVKGGPALRAFVPQFQTTFVKALSDPSRQVRVEAIGALSLLMPLSTRVDPLIKELVAGSLGKNLSAEGLAAAAIQTATLEALSVVLAKGGAKAKLPASVPSALHASKELLKNPDQGIREAAAKVMGEACALLPVASAEETVNDEILNGDLATDSSTGRHGKACAIRRILASKVGLELTKDSVMMDGMRDLTLAYLTDDKGSVREAGCIAIGAVIGRSPDGPKAGFAKDQPALLKILNNSQENMDTHRALARGLCVALKMIDGSDRLDCMGLALVDACLQLALSGTQRVQFAYNDVLWLALDVSSGQDGLDRYANMAVFDNVRAMRSLHSKVLVRIKEITLD